MPSSNDHPEYDENLLSSAPAPTKGMVQSGYTTELLKPELTRRGDPESGIAEPLSKHTSIRPRTRPIVNGVESKIVSTTSLPKVPAKTPFYRTKRGIIILFIVAIVLLAAIIGGVVGGLRKKGLPSSVASSVPPQIVSNGAVDSLPSSSRPDGQGGGVPDSSTPASPPAGTLTSTITIFTTPTPLPSDFPPFTRSR